MNESYSLIKENPLLPAEDYDALRKEGFKSIEKLGSNIWTDYNNSDPGITILEAVCYAITDLAYRTEFDVKDLLTPEHLTEDTWNNIFYTARQILHNNPLTISDYRKLILDIKGVRNAWIEASKDYEVPVWVDYNLVERRKDTDCGCTDQELKTCYGKLSLQQITEQAAKERNEKRLEVIETRAKEIAKILTPLDNKINKLNEAIVAENDEIEKLTLQNVLQSLIAERDKLSAQLQELELEKKLIDEMKFLPAKILEIEGLYNVMVEYEDDVLEEKHREEIRQLVVERLVAHRNLCEDFLTVNAVDYLDFGIGGSIVLEEYADPDNVLAEIFYVIYKYFSPSVQFYSIPQMIEKGYQVDEIFEGPALHHGFIDTEELEKTNLYRDIRLSDIISEISDIVGVKAITYLRLPFNGFDGDNGKFYFNEWVKLLQDEKKIARIQPSLSSMLFCKQQEFITYNAGRDNDKSLLRAIKLFNDKKKQERTYKLQGHANNFPVPTGEFMELQDYFPITESLPNCYGVSKRAGLPSSADEKRKVQAKQLKGYMLFFEQIVAGYLTQLDHVRDLFSFDKQKKTYFTRALLEIDELKSLLIDHANRGDNHFEEILKDFSHVLQNITEAPEGFEQRRNMFLDHLLARFSESMQEYEEITQWQYKQKAGTRLIKDKERLLKDGAYYKISTNRGKAFNYTPLEVWDTRNVSGAERRIGGLLGFSNSTRRTLTPSFIRSEQVMVLDEKTKTFIPKKNKKGQYVNVIKLFSPDNNEKIILTSVEVADGCCTELLMGQLLEHADDRHNFKFHEALKPRSRKSAGEVGSFWFELWDNPNPEKGVLLATSQTFEKSKEREAVFDELQKLIDEVNENEGMHLIEHLLLRPKMDEVLDEVGDPLPVVLPDICLDVCDLGKGLDEAIETPPFQKRIHRIPSEKCYDKMPWVLEYLGLNAKKEKYDQSLLFQETFDDNNDPIPLKFRRYEKLAQRVKDLEEFGSERINYVIHLSEEKNKYRFEIQAEGKRVLAQSPYIYQKKDIEAAIEKWMQYFEYQLDWYCEENACDNNEDPFSFRTTIVLPCWPKRLRDKTFRNFVEKTIEAETPAHIHTRVVWLGITQMKKFEESYAAWLLEMAQTEMPSYEVVNPFIETLNKLVACNSCADDCGPE